jgi:hypothetical protein
LVTLTRDFWNGFGYGLILFAIVAPFAGLRAKVGLATVAMGCLIRALGRRFAPQGDKGWGWGFLLSCAAFAGIVFITQAFPQLIMTESFPD